MTINENNRVEKLLPQMQSGKGSSSVDVNSFIKTSSEYHIQEARVKTIEQAQTDREHLKNKDLRQDIDLKRMTLMALLVLLALETMGVFVVALCQGFQVSGFKLEEWSFKLVVTATLLQTYMMLKIAVDYLFPRDKTQEK